AELEAFRTLAEEASVFERTATDYHKTLTLIIKHHYEERRRRVVSGLQSQIDVEQEKVEQSRDEAIRRLEDFIRRYSGANAHPEASPAVMFRLAALYEEKAREDFEGDLSQTLQPAMQLYRQIISDFPQYKQTAGVHYYLGHAYLDTGML